MYAIEPEKNCNSNSGDGNKKTKHRTRTSVEEKIPMNNAASTFKIETIKSDPGHTIVTKGRMCGECDST